MVTTHRARRVASDAFIESATRIKEKFGAERFVSVKDAIWRDLCSEYDSIFIYKYCLEHEYLGSATLSEIIQDWRQDEWRHHLAFRIIYATLFGYEIRDLKANLKHRTPDFSRLVQFMQDPIGITTLLAFDEIATVRAYSADYEFYDLLGEPLLSAWIREVVRDEVRHYNRFVQFIREHTLSERYRAVGLVDEVVALDAKKLEYAATFVMDHTAKEYDGEFLCRCGDHLKRRIGVGMDI